MRNTNEFRTLAKDEIAKLEKDVYGRDVTHEEIEIVFMSYVMGYIKGLFVVARNTEGRICRCRGTRCRNCCRTRRSGRNQAGSCHGPGQEKFCHRRC